MGIRFLTLRRRTTRLIEHLRALPSDQWSTVRLSNIGRTYRTPRVFQSHIQLRNYPGLLRQIAITNLGHDKPTLLITNDEKTAPAKLIDRYARRMLIKNDIANAIDFFHMDALSAAVPLKIDIDLQLTLIASGLYRMLANRMGGARSVSRDRTLFRDYINAPGIIIIGENEIVVRLGRRAHNGELFRAGYHEMVMLIPWLQNRKLSVDFL